METISAGVHIFGKNQTKAVDNYFIYLELASDKDFTTFLKELKLNNGFHERCAKLGILHFDTELTILEKKDRKLVVVNNNTSWKHALKLLLRDDAELHVKIFDVKRVSSCSFFEATQDVRTKDSESSEPATKKIKSHHATHSDETKAKISLWHRIKDAQKMGIDIVRNNTEQKMFQEFTKDIAALASSVAVNEIDVNCGLCGKTVMMNKVRARAYFIKKHFKKCQDKKKNQMTIESCLKKSKNTVQDDDNNSPKQDGNNNDSVVQGIQGGSDNDTNNTDREEEKQESDASEIIESGDEMLHKPLQPVITHTSFDLLDQLSSLSCELSNCQTCELPSDINMTSMPDETYNSELPDNTTDLNETYSKDDFGMSISDSINTEFPRSPKLAECHESQEYISISDDQLNSISALDDYDSCSDFESEFHDENLYENIQAVLPLHMSNPCFDAGGERLIFADRVAERLDLLISKGEVPDDHIFYKIIDNITKYIHHSNIHKHDGIKFIWDPVVVNWCNSLLYLGGNKTYNFVRGPGNFKRGRQSPFDLERFNLPLPDERTCRHHSPAFTTRPGIIIELLLCIIHLLNNMSVIPLVENERCSIFGMSMGRDGIGLKPELSFDPIRKVLVGSKFDIDANYVKNNPNLDVAGIKALKDSMIKDADTLVLTDLTNSVSLPVGLDYSSHIQSSDDVKKLVEKRVQEAQICSGCLELKKEEGKVVGDVSICCNRSCEACRELGQVCNQCKINGQISILPQLRACERCIENNIKCNRMVVMVVIHDCEQKNKTAMEKIIDDKIEGRQIPELSLTGVGPDAVHIGKCLAGSLSNWWLLVDNYRINLIILRMLRQTQTTMGNVFRENISLDSVQRKDRQATAAIAEISSEKVLDCLHNSDNDMVVCTVVPEKYRKCDDNHPRILKEPVDICLSDDPSVLYVADRVGVIYSVRLHYPAEVKQLAKGLSTPSSIMNLDGILFVCESGKNKIVYIDHKDTLKLDISKSTKRNLCEYATFLEITNPEKSNLKTLRQIINSRIEATGLPRGTKDTVRVFDIGIDAVVPTKLVKVDKDLFFVADQKTKSILQVSVKRKVAAYGYDLFGTSLYSISVPHMSGCFGLAYSSNYLYLADHTAGILRLELDSNTVSVILKTGTEFCNQPHGIVIVGTELIYSDVGKRALYKIKDIENVSLNQPDVVLFAGKGEEGNEDGLGKDCQFSQPSGICIEGNTLFVIDSGSKNIRLVTSLSPMHKYLSVLRDIYKSFSVHTEILGSGHSDDIRMSISKLKDVEKFFEKCTSEAKTLLDLKINCLQGPHGVPASKTIQSIHMLRTMLESLSEQITGIESKYLEKVDINSALTLVNEQLHSMLRLKTETPSVLDCARDFLRGVVECVKRVSLCGYHYFTSKKTSGYESPKQYLSLAEFPKFQRDKPSSVSKEDVKLLFEFRERYGKGVRQRSVRADTTKFNAGTLPLNMYQNNIPPKYASIDLSVTDIRINKTAEDPSLTEPHTIDKMQSSNLPAGPVLDSIYDENDLVAVMLDDQLSLGSFTECVFETDLVCKAILYKETGGLEFHKDIQRDIPINCILERVIPPLLPGQVVYTLDEETYNRLTSSLQTDTMTINEEVSETFEEEEIVPIVLSCERSRRGRTVKKPRYLMDFY